MKMSKRKSREWVKMSKMRRKRRSRRRRREWVKMSKRRTRRSG